MRRRDLMTLAGAAAASAGSASAQSPAGVHRIGVLNSTGPGIGPFQVAFINGLARYGYVPGKNLAIEARGAEGHADRLNGLVAELAASRVEVILAVGYPSALAARQATTLPTVVFSAGDPVATGLAESLARPGGHLTGISDVSVQVTPKRLELLKEVAPNLRRVAMLYNADDLAMTLRYRASEAGARALGIAVQPLGVRAPDDFDAAFAAMQRELPDGILMVSDPLTNLNRPRVFAFAAAHRLPGIYEYDFIAKGGGLMSYGLDLDESFERVAALIDHIFKGAKPADLPFEQPTLFTFALNTTAAKAIGLDFPPLLLARADEVFE